MTPFWELDHTGTALIENTEYHLSYSNLAQAADRLATKLGTKRQLILAQASHHSSFVILYLACLRAQHVLMLQPPSLSEQALESLQSIYRPNWFFSSAQNLQACHDYPMALDSRLRLLLTTSGSTGSRKLVMLSAHNLAANAQRITEFLPITEHDRAITNLPLHYSYGLSILNTHLQMGAVCVLCQHSVLNRSFWHMFHQHKVTSLSGVPSTYDLFLRLKFEQMHLPSLRYLTQAGGALAAEKSYHIANTFVEKQVPFYRMYGQTEATARIAWLAPELLARYPDSIGQAIPGGLLGLRSGQKDNFSPEQSHTGELLYQGPNVMLGYATCLADLAKASAPTTLATGDLAQYMGNDIYQLIGRKNRIIKLQGHRIHLDELEHQLEPHVGLLACCYHGQQLRIFLTKPDLKRHLDTKMTQMGLHKSLYRVHLLSALPQTSSGKIDYQSLKQYE